MVLLFEIMLFGFALVFLSSIGIVLFIAIPAIFILGLIALLYLIFA